MTATLSYAARGWYVIPLHSIGQGRCTCTDRGCKHPGKHPRIRTGRDHACATIEEAILRGWWDQWPSANVGIVTGARSGLVVLDVDPKNGGLDTLRRLETEQGPLPSTPTVVTGSGGLHLYFLHLGTRVPNRAGLFPGIDLRGDGGFVVAPPSQHALGHYRWKT